MLPPEALVTESGELSEQGKTYIPPRILQEALCVIACGPGMEGEPEEKEKLVLEMLLVSSHPSLGERRGRGRTWMCERRGFGWALGETPGLGFSLS